MIYPRKNKIKRRKKRFVDSQFKERDNFRKFTSIFLKIIVIKIYFKMGIV